MMPEAEAEAQFSGELAAQFDPTGTRDAKITWPYGSTVFMQEVPVHDERSPAGHTEVQTGEAVKGVETSTAQLYCAATQEIRGNDAEIRLRLARPERPPRPHF
ncbi:unnamed protein product [Diplocarpon coronariae]